MADWTNEQIDTLRSCWTEGISATNIIVRLNYVFSRSAILGKASRLGLQKRRSAGRERKLIKPSAPREMPRFVKNTDSKPLPEPPPPPPKIEPVKPKRLRNRLSREFNDNVFFNNWISNLTTRLPNIYRIPKNGHCKFITGEVISPTSYWCDKGTDGGSWCAYHKKIVYQAPETYRRNKK